MSVDIKTLLAKNNKADQVVAQLVEPVARDAGEVRLGREGQLVESLVQNQDPCAIECVDRLAFLFGDSSLLLKVIQTVGHGHHETRGVIHDLGDGLGAVTRHGVVRLLARHQNLHHGAHTGHVLECEVLIRRGIVQPGVAITDLLVRPIGEGGDLVRDSLVVPREARGGQPAGFEQFDRLPGGVLRPPVPLRLVALLDEFTNLPRDGHDLLELGLVQVDGAQELPMPANIDDRRKLVQLRLGFPKDAYATQKASDSMLA